MTVQGVQAHLRDDGLFIFGTRAPAPAQLDIDHEETMWNRYIAPEGREIAVSGFQTYDSSAQIQHWTTIRRWRDADGQPWEWVTRIAIRYGSQEEIAALLRDNGVSVRSSHGSWEGEELTSASERMVFVCRKS
jgi:hypothetical protein